MSLPFWRSYMKVSMSRTMGYSISLVVSSKREMGPTLIIWCTAGVNGIVAPAILAIRGLQTPQAMTIYSVSMSPREVRMAFTRPFSISIPRTSVFGKVDRASSSWAFSRIKVPVLRESTTATEGV